MNRASTDKIKNRIIIQLSFSGAMLKFLTKGAATHPASDTSSSESDLPIAQLYYYYYFLLWLCATILQHIGLC